MNHVEQAIKAHLRIKPMSEAELFIAMEARSQSSKKYIRKAMKRMKIV